MPASPTVSPEVAALDALGAVWSPDTDAYASGQLEASRIRCVLCRHVPCDCPPFGSPEYLALMDARLNAILPWRAAPLPGIGDPCESCGHGADCGCFCC